MRDRNRVWQPASIELTSPDQPDDIMSLNFPSDTPSCGGREQLQGVRAGRHPPLQHLATDTGSPAHPRDADCPRDRRLGDEFKRNAGKPKNKKWSIASRFDLHSPLITPCVQRGGVGWAGGGGGVGWGVVSSLLVYGGRRRGNGL